MATTVEIPKGFTLDEEPTVSVNENNNDANLPEGFTLDSKEISEPTNAYTRNRNIIQSSLEGLLTGGGAVAGGIAGATSGSIVPFAGTVAGAAGGSGVGGTLGFAASQEIMDILDNAFGVTQPEGIVSEIKELGQELKTGAEISFGGELIGPLARPIAKQLNRPLKFVKDKMPPLSMSGMKKKAGEILADIGTEGTKSQIRQNIKIAKELESKIPELKFTRGQLTNDAQAISLERALVRKGGADLQQEQRTFANRALQNYYDNKLSNTGKVSDFTEALISQREGLESTMQTSQNKIGSEIDRLSRVMDDDVLSRKLLDQIKTSRQVMKDDVDKAFSRIPKTMKVKNTGSLLSKVDDVISTVNVNEASEDIPKKLIDDIASAINPSGIAVRNLSVDDLRAFASRAGNASFKASQTGNKRLSSLNLQIKEAVNSTLDDMADASDVPQVIRNAVSLRRDFGVQFEQGTIADVLQRGSRGEETKIALSNIASKFFNKDSIGQFLNVMGDDVLAVDTMRDFARLDLLNKAQNPLTGEVTQQGLARWIAKNGKVLDRLGIRQEFQNTQSLQAGLDLAKKNLDQFNKSIASDILKADVDNLVTVAYSGSKNIDSRTKELISLAKGNKNAEAGLRKAVADHLLAKSKTTGIDLFGDPIISVANLTKQIQQFNPALRILYKDSPKKMQAINDVHKAYRILDRNLKSPLGAGSDTAENIANATVSVVAPLATSRFAQVNAIKALTRSFTEFSQERINNYMLRASFDSDYAQTLINLARNPESRQAIKRFGDLMVLPNLAAEKVGLGVKDFIQRAIPEQQTQQPQQQLTPQITQ